MAKWIWKCPFCNAKGKKPVSHHKALHYGKWHIIRVHHRIHKDPVMKRILK